MKRININTDKFKLLTEYTFIDDDTNDNISDYLLLDDDLNEEDSVEVADDMPEAEPENPETPEDLNLSDDNENPDDENVDLGSDIEVEDEPAPNDEVELDITELVDGIDQTNSLATKASQGVADLSQKLDRLTASLEKMSSINDRITNIEKEIIKRNPTQVEKLEMRSLDSYPYNLKLTDFWGGDENKTPNSYVQSKNGIPSSNEYILTQNDVDSDYNEHAIKKTFDYTEEETED